MKKLLLTLLTSLVLSGAAWAEWVLIIENVSIYRYIDPATIRKEGSLRRVWEIQNFKRPNKIGELSYRVRAEYDCKQERDRLLSFSTHSEYMASGATLYSSPEGPGTWNDIPPGSIAETVLKIVCAK
jgi:hypothetical protein